jgi:heme/copper-type cytochrome/quinol oxidase subunit 4
MTDPGATTAHDEAEDEPGPEPSWWHRSHPTFAGLVGFFSGVAYVIIVPGIYAAALGLLLSDSTAQRLFPLVAVALLVPLAMLIPRKTRRFAQFMLLGVVTTAVVIGVTAAVVIWVMVKLDG